MRSLPFEPKKRYILHLKISFRVSNFSCIYFINFQRRKTIYEVENQEKPTYLCSETCLVSFRTLNKSVPEVAKSKAPQTKDVEKQIPESSVSAVSNKIFTRKCSECSLPINSADEKVLSWETMDFCNEDCLCMYIYFK